MTKAATNKAPTDLDALLGTGQPPKPDTIPVDKLVVCWKRKPGTDKVTRVRVMHLDAVPAGSVDGPDNGGCRERGWLTDALGTPLGLFVDLMAHGFASREELIAALHQFRNVHGQETWANFLLWVAGDTEIERILGDEAVWGSEWRTRLH